MKIQHFKNGLTVRELKALIKDWPEVDHYTEDDTEVWVDNSDGTSDICTEVSPLNLRNDEDGSSADILFGK